MLSKTEKAKVPSSVHSWTNAGVFFCNGDRLRQQNMVYSTLQGILLLLCLKLGF